MGTDKSKSISSDDASSASKDLTTSALHNLARDITMEIFPNGDFASRDKQTEQLLQSKSEFAVGEQLGAGGMGRIYRARQKDLQRDVAIKQLHPHLCEVERIRKGFFNEAIVTGKLAHPNVVPVYGLSESQHSLSMSMKLISGCTLEDIIIPVTRQHEQMAAKFDIDDCIEVIIAICNPVAFAHSKEIIHRDIKPGNVMVGEFGEILLLDWGLACSISNTPEADIQNGIPHVSVIPGIEGTLAYMSPEMMNGVGRELGVHSDIYLLGACLYFVLTGKAPHLHRKQRLTDIPEERDYVDPLPEHIDSELRRICSQAMAKEPAERYPSVKIFQAELKDYLKHQESRRVAEHANTLLANAQKNYSLNLDSSGRISLFHDLSECLSAYRQSLALWDGNEEARNAYRQAGLAAARMMFNTREYKAALVYLKDIKGPEASEIRQKIKYALLDSEKANRARVYLRGVSITLIGLLLASVISFWFVFRFMDKTAMRVGEEARKSLVINGKRDLTRVVRNAATAMGFEKQTVNTSLNQLVRSFEMALINNTSTGNAAVDGVAKVFAMPPGRESDAINRANEVGYAMTQPFNVPKAETAVQSIALTQIAPLVSRLYDDNKNLIIRFFIGFNDTQLLSTFPKKSAKQVNGPFVDSGWFARGRDTEKINFTPPYRDPATNRIVTSAVLPVHDAAGNFLGVAGADLHILDLLQPLKVDPNWSDKCKIEIARIVDDEIEIIFSDNYEHLSSPHGDASWVQRDRISNIDAKAFSQMTQDLANGTEGVVSFSRNNKSVLWGYAPLGIQNSFVLITVAHETLAKEADRIHNTIVRENTAALLYIGKVVGLIFGALLVLSALLALQVMRRRLKTQTLPPVQ
ncbi:MAG: protein kinase [Deltaproteobacteria bacterium]|nr:protein kinase [Deltaproteobacteria bacterium]